MTNTRNTQKVKKKKPPVAARHSTRLKESRGKSEDFPETITVASSLSTSDPTPITSDSRSGSPSIPDASPSPLAKPKRAVSKRAAAESINDSENASDDDAPPLIKKRKKQKEREEDKPDPNRIQSSSITFSPELLLYIPRAGSDGTQRKNLTHAVTFDDVLDVIHDIVGCTDVAVKPKLSYRLSTAGPRADAISISDETDWAGCLEEVTAMEKLKKGVVVSVRIIVSDQYLQSLLAQKGKGTAGGSKKKGKLQILDLEHAGSDDDDFDDGPGVMVAEAKHLESLQKMHSRCQRCGPTKGVVVSVRIIVSDQSHFDGTESHSAYRFSCMWVTAAPYGRTRVMPNLVGPN
ncbi:hypothetical protein GGX14DRAFT_396964 [Mycena pura]|uniref:Uncharacterized protein n=1 Tax=Mycena pura TaxID=153505 RepID=A0AAD6YAZ5_9AGAR|nr:hypothetical protein GGX14DRAFT_396964 [Mycena pura]